MNNLVLASCLDDFSPKLPQVFNKPISELKVLCIPTAAYGEDNYSWLPEEQAPLKNHAKNFTEFDLKGKSRTDVAAAVLGKDLVYVTGGNTYYLLEHVRKSGFDEVLKNYIAQGGQYLGTSAGAVLMCPRIDFIADMDDPSKADLSDFSALALIDFYVMPHIDHPKYGVKANPCIASLLEKGEQVIGLQDNQALWIQGDYIRVL